MNLSGVKFPISDRVVGAMATYPARFETLERVVASIAPQLDYLFIYINEARSAPHLGDFPNVITLLADEFEGNLSATGKVFPLKLTSNCVYFCLDDDFIYPPDYVRTIHALLAKCSYKLAVTVHGSIFAPGAEWYYEKSVVYASKQPLATDTFVTLPGSGTFAFHQNSLRARFEDFPREPLVDLKFGILAREQGLPVVCKARQANWLSPLPALGLWEQFQKGLTHHTSEMRKAGSWDFAMFRDVYRDFFDRANDAAQSIDPQVRLALTTGQVPSSWCRSVNAVKQRNNYLRLLANREGQP